MLLREIKVCPLSISQTHFGFTPSECDTLCWWFTDKHYRKHQRFHQRLLNIVHSLTVYAFNINQPILFRRNLCWNQMMKNIESKTQINFIFFLPNKLCVFLVWEAVAKQRRMKIFTKNYDLLKLDWSILSKSCVHTLKSWTKNIFTVLSAV